MLKQHQYDKLAEDFQATLGIAEWNGGPMYELRTRNVRKIPDDFKVMILTSHIIQKEIYQQVIREVLRLENKYKNKRINKSTIYEKAINNIIEGNG